MATLSIACPMWSTVSGTKACTLVLGSTQTSSKVVLKAVKLSPLRMVKVLSGGPLTEFWVQISSNFADQVDPLLGRAFLEDMHKLLVGCRAGGLPSSGLQLEQHELVLVLVLCWEDLMKQRQNRLERRRLELPAMAQERRLLCQESHLITIGLNIFF
jgi:hypothetical protein